MIRVIVIFIVLLLTFICGIGAAIEYYEDKINKIKREHEKEIKEIERLNNIIEIKTKRIQQLMKRTRSARIDKAIEYLERKQKETEWWDTDFMQCINILKGEDNEED